ncbi:MAG: hypothetical protein IT328_24030 [Caldilineaceae bacterium]|nr:hypothetical protein [Caldilineaceae bacterium]
MKFILPALLISLVALSGCGSPRPANVAGQSLVENVPAATMPTTTEPTQAPPLQGFSPHRLLAIW